MTVVPTLLGKVDLNPALVSQTGGPMDLSLWAADITIQATDYSSGFSDTLVKAALGVGAILAVFGQVTNGGTLKAQFPLVMYDAATSKIRGVLPLAGATGDYTAANSDVFRIALLTI